MSPWSRIRSHLSLRVLLITCLALAAIASFLALSAQAWVGSPEEDQPHSPWLFVENQGQYEDGARFLLLNGRGSTWLAEDALWLTLWEGPVDGGEAERDDGSQPERLRGVNLRLTWVGSAPQAVLEPTHRQDTHVSYLLGSDRDEWRADVPVWGSVRYQELYPEIDLALGGSGAGEDGFAPWWLEAGVGADLAAVQLRVEGAQQVSVAGDALVLSTTVGEVRLPLPSIHVAEGDSGDSFLADNSPPSVRRIGSGIFEVAAPFRRGASAAAGGGPTDHPEDLIYSAFLGGGSWDLGFASAVDASGAAYVAGGTPSTDFPTVPGSFDTVINYQDAFLVKVDPTGDSLVYATFLGGMASESGYGLALSGNLAYVAGKTNSSDFPTTAGAYDLTCGSDGMCDDHSDAYLVKVNATGTDLLYGTYLGGSDEESDLAVSVEDGIAYLAGETYSDDLPTTAGAYDTTCGTDGHCDPYQGDPVKDAFLLIVSPSGGGESDLLYGTYLGGWNEDTGRGVVAVGGQAYVVGQSWSDDFLEAPYAGNGDVFAVKINPAGGGAGDLVYGTLIGGTGTDAGEAIAVAGGLAYLTGETRSVDFPASGAYGGGFNDAFVAQLDIGGTLGYALFVGGSDRDQGRELIVNSSGQVVFAGDSRSADFPTTPDSYDPTINGGRDVVVVRLDLGEPDPIIHSSFLGGISDDVAYGLAVDGFGCAYLTGDTKSSTSFPTTPESFDPDYNGGLTDGFVSKLRVGPSGSVAIEKRTNGQDADAPPGPYLLVGQAVEWTYVVTNTGDVELSTVSAVDDQGVLVECPTDTLVPGEEMVCTASGTAVEGQYANIGTAFGTPPIGPVVTSEDPSHYFGAIPDIDLEKHTNGEDADGTTGPYILVGDEVVWEYTVTNTGNVALTNVTVTDDVLGPVCTLPALGVGQTEICTVVGTAEAGQYANLGTATGTPPVGPDVTDSDASHYFGALTALDLEKHTNGEDGDSAPGLYIPVGDQVLWEYVVSNTGNVDLADVTVTDDLLGLVCTLPTLGAGQTETCTASGTSEPGQYANLGLATGTPPGGLPDVGDSDASHYFGAEPDIDLEKHTNGEDADGAPGLYIPVGDPVLWEYAVSNTGNVDLSDVTVTDDVLGPVCSIGTLAVGETQTCTADGMAEAGQYANLGTAVGSPPGGLPDVSDLDPSHYFGSAPAIDLEKHTNGQDADGTPGPYVPVGDPILWEYAVTNAGNVDLTDVTVNDDVLGPVCTLPTLGVGQTETCTVDGTAEAGQYANLGTVLATPPVGPDVDDTDPSHYFGAIPAIDLGKYTNGEDADGMPGPYISAGDSVLWEYQVSNTGNVELTGIEVTDDQLGLVCTIDTLAPGATESCTTNGTAVAGQYANLGAVTGTPPSPLPDVLDDDPSHYYGVLASLDLEKHTNGQDADGGPGPYIPVGDAVVWEYAVTNTSNVDLADVVVSDDVLGVVCTFDTLAVGVTEICIENGVAGAGQYANLGTAVGSPPGGLPGVSDEDPSHYFGATTGISLVKTTNGEDANTPPGPYVLVGEMVTWEYGVTNGGNVALSNVVVTDDQLGEVCTIGTLAPGATQSCTEVSTAEAGQYSNLGMVIGTPPGGLPDVSDTDPSYYYGAIMTMDLEKLTNGEDADLPPGPYILPGEPVVWTYSIENTGNVDLSGIVVVDDNGTPGDPADDYSCEVGTLPPGGVDDTTCEQTGIAEAGQYANLATGEGTFGAWSATDSDASHYRGVVPGIDLEKLTEGQDADAPPGPYLQAGEVVTWVYVVANVGDLDVVDVTVVDDNGTPDEPGDDYTCTIDLIPQGEVDDTTCVQVGVVQAGQYGNLASAEGESGGFPVADLDPSHYYGVLASLDLEKHTNGQDADGTPGPYIPVGDAVLWEYAVTNTGNADLSDVTVSDDVLGPVCTIETLAVDETQTCMMAGTAEAGQYANLGTATGSPPGGLPDVSDLDPSHYFGSAPAIDLEKHTNGQDADGTPGPYVPVGNPILWEYAVTNTGNVDLSAVTVSDDVLGAVCTIGALAIGETETCTMAGTAEAGQYANWGMVTATPPGGLADVSDTDESHYFGAEPDIDLEKHTNGQDADGTPGPYISAGDSVLWEYQVSNTGNVELTGIEVTDDQVGLVCVIDTLAPGATESCTTNGTAVAGQYANLGAAVGTPPSPLPDVSDDDPSHYYGVLASLDLEKHTNGQDADGGPGPYIPVGDAVVWEYAVTNTSNVELADVVVSDDVLGVVCTFDALAVGVTEICIENGVAGAGQYANLGTAVGSPPGGLPSVSDEDPSHYYGAAPGILLAKTTNGEDADSPPGPEVPVGEPVTWEYTATNEGNVPLSNVVITDDLLGLICTIPSLGVGASDSCSHMGNASIGQYSNVGAVTGTPPGGLPDVEASDPSHYFGVLLSIDVEKATNGEDADLPPGPYIIPGEPVAWTYSIENTGNVELSDITLVDDNGTPGDPADDYTCVVGALPPGGMDDTSCLQSGTAEAGPYANLATAEGWYGAWSATDSDPSHYLGVVPGLDLEKYTEGEDADVAPGPYLAVGEVVTWVYAVANVGDLDLVDVTVVDDNGTPEDPADDYVCTIDLIQPGDVDDTTCVQVGVVQAGQYENLASAEGESGGFPVADLDPSHYYGVLASLDLEKHTNGQDADGAPGPYILVGDAVLWEYAVTNTGNAELSDVTVSDDVLGPVCTIETLAVDETQTCMMAGTAEAGQYANLGTAVGSPPGGLADVSDQDPSHYFGSAPDIDLEKHTSGQDADGAPGPYIAVGDAVQWEYAVTNTGNVDLSGVTVSDDVLGAVCTIGALGIGETETCTMAGTAEAGQYSNVGIVVGTPPGGLADVGDSDPSHYFGAAPAIDLEKHTNEQDADGTPGPYILVGDAVQWEYEVSNTGNVDLSGVTVTDDELGPVCTIATLAVGETQTCSENGAAEAGQYANVGTATGTPPGELPDVSDDDPSHYFGVLASLDLEKHTNGQDADAGPGPYIPVGDQVTWEYTVTNGGNVDLTDVTISDDVLGSICTIPTLSAGASDSCDQTGTATAGQYANVGTAVGAPPLGPDVSDQDPSHYFGADVSISLVKTTNGQDANSPTGPYILVGDLVTWEYEVTNEGNVELTGVAVTDDMLGPVCTIGTLAAGATESCMELGTAEAGQYSNLGIVTGTPPGGLPDAVDDDPSYYFGALVTMDLEKLTNGEDADLPPGPYIMPGDDVVWNYTIANTGNVELAGIVVVDDNGTPGDPDDDYSCEVGTLPPGGVDETTCEQTGIAEAGQYANLATGEGTFGDWAATDSDASHYRGVVPGLDLEKLTEGQDADAPPGPYLQAGEPVSWVYAVANVGDVDVVDVTVVDDNGTPEDPADDYVCTIDLIQPGDVDDTTCVQVGTVQPGQYGNLASAEGQSGGFPVADQDPSHYFGVAATLDLEKHTNGEDADGTPGPYIPVGGAVLWEYSVTNTGNVDLTNVMVTDDVLGLVCTLPTLGIGDAEICTANGTAEAGQYANLGTAIGTPPGGLPDATDTDPSHYYGSAPAIDLEKHTNGQDADDPPGVYILTGNAVLWEYAVTNTGNVGLTDVLVSDDVLGLVCTLPALGVGQTETCTANGIAQEGQYANLGTVVGTPPVGPDVSDTDESHYFGAEPGIGLEKHTNGQDADGPPGPYIPVGDAVQWEYAVSNTGNVSLSAVMVTDDVLGLVCTLPALGIGQTEICTANGTAEAGQYSNLGTASGAPPGGLPDVVDTDASHYFGAAPAINLEKHTNGQDADDPPGVYILTGGAVLWEYAVTNTGNVGLANVLVSDDVLGLVCTLPTLGVGQTETCTANGIAQEGQYANLGTATGTPEVGADVTDSDASHYFGSSPGVHLEKHTNGEDADIPPGPYILVGDTVTWEYIVSNTGNVPLTDITVSDDQGVLISCPQSTLEPDEQMTCDASADATLGQYANLGTVECTPPAGPTLLDEDASHYFGALLALDLEKLTNGEDADAPPGPSIMVGEPVTWTYHLTNTGNVVLTEILVTDDQGVDVSCPLETLEPGEAMQCSAYGIAIDGLYENLGTAIGYFGDSDVWDTDLSHYTGGGAIRRLYLPLVMR